MATLPYRESLGTKPLRPGGAQRDHAPSLDPDWSWSLIGLGVLAAIVLLLLWWLAG